MENILVIEDDLIMRENIAELLELSGYSVSTADNGKDGVELARANLPDLIVCDIRMPNLDGYGVLHILSKTPETAAIPFIFLTAKTELSDLRKGMNLGADDYIMKPFEDTELLKSVELRLKKKQIISDELYDHSNIVDKNHIGKGVLDLIREIAVESSKFIFNKKEIIFRPDDQPNSIYYLESGRVKTYLLNEDGKELISAIIEEGNIFGYQASIEKRKYREFAAAVEDAVVRKISIEEFEGLFKEDKDFAKGMIKIISSDLTEKEDELLNMAYSSVKRRLTIKLLELTAEHGEDYIDISRSDLASLLGTSTETLVRSLSELKEMDLLSVENKGIKIINRDKLISLSRHW